MNTWLQAGVCVSRQTAGQMERLMHSQGAVSVTLTDVGDQPILEPGVGETPLWDAVRIMGLFPGDTPAETLASVLSLAPGVTSPRQVTLERVEDRDWERAWLEDLEPMRFGQGLWIVPTGREAPEEGETVMRLDPGLAFGTGTHATTRLCLEWLERQDLQDLAVLDYGCGSGVLGIAAALKGASKVYCVDNDPQALSATAGNADRNGVENRIEVSDATRAELPRADVVIANILAGTLVTLAPRLCAALAGGGRIALSGILDHQANEVAAAYVGEAGRLETTNLDGWVLLATAGPTRN